MTITFGWNLIPIILTAAMFWAALSVDSQRKGDYDFTTPFMALLAFVSAIAGTSIVWLVYVLVTR